VRVADSAEGSGRTIEAAIEAARAKLGVDRDRLDVEVLAEPVASSFGVIGSPAQVRVTVRELPPGSSPGGSPAGEPPPPGTRAASPPVAGPAPAAAPSRPPIEVDPELAAQQAELAGDFVEGLLELLDLEADITTWVDQAGGHIDVEGPDLGVLVGRDGETLTALEELTRLSVVRQTGERARISLDVDGFKQQRRQAIVRSAQETADRVLRSGLPEEMEPMSAYERKVVHDVVGAIDGLYTESVGEEPRRRVSIIPGG
jgi:spoIIIJ-associated protein